MSGGRHGMSSRVGPINGRGAVGRGSEKGTCLRHAQCSFGQRRYVVVSWSRRTMMPTMTAVVCTHNRADVLDRCLQALDRQTDLDLQVLVVDNASTDATADLAARWCEQRTGWRVIREPEPGLCHARNAAITASSTDLIAYVDDDALPWPSWAVHIRSVFVDPDVVGAGGPIILQWTSSRPRWLPRHGETYLTTLDPDGEPSVLVWPTHPFGANMAFRRDVLVALGGFDPQLGRNGRSLRSGEESALFEQLADERRRVAFAPQAGVQHVVDPGRSTMRFMLRRSFAQGQTQVQMRTVRNPGAASVGALVRSATVGTLRSAAWTARLRAEEDGWVATCALFAMEVARSLGNSYELLVVVLGRCRRSRVLRRLR